MRIGRRPFLANLLRTSGAFLLPRAAAPVFALPAPQAPNPPAVAAWFTDVAPRSNLAYRTLNDYTGRKYFPQPMCGGVAALDYDNDGWMDLFFTNGAKLPELTKSSPQFSSAPDGARRPTSSPRSYRPLWYRAKLWSAKAGCRWR